MKSLLSRSFTFVLLAFLISCTGSTQKLATDSTGGESIFPGWYNSTGFSSDSLSFSGFGVAIGADSTDAVERAEVEAENQLGFQLSKLAEDIRVQLERENVTAASNVDFILLLRNATSSLKSFSETTNQYMLSPNNNFRAIAEVSITRDKAHQLFENAFNGHPRYWAAFSQSNQYQNTILK